MAQQQGRSPEAIINEAVASYLQTRQVQAQATLSRGQTLINLMQGKATADLSTDEIMQLTRQHNV